MAPGLILMAFVSAAMAMPDAGFFSTGVFEGITNDLRDAGALIGQRQAAFTPALASPPPPSEFPVRGIDVSHHQDDIDWKKVATAGLSFVYIKATESDDFTDDRFMENWKGAGQAGLRRGAYHFYDFCKKGAPQAQLYLDTVPVEFEGLPPVVDLELSGSCRRLPKPAAFKKEFDAFVAKIQAAHREAPLLYVSYEIYDRYFANSPEPLRIWITDFIGRPALSDKRDWVMWQFSEKGRIPGIGGPVDLDVFNGTPQQFAALGVDPAPVLVASER
ncbi:MAG: lysozyme [Elusimicrobia bacterium]|nr:lysozyme [Elusimicrobiota bacterium]